MTSGSSEQVNDVTEVHNGDVGGKFLATIDEMTRATSISRLEYRRTLWKIDLFILPLITGTVILSAVDKVIISNTAILGMKKDLKLVDNEFAWIGTIFYFGYLVFEWPTAILIQRLPVAKLLAALVFAWAVLMCCTAITHDFASLAAVRFIIGCTEAGAFPIASIITVMWYSNKEQPIRVAFWYNSLSSIFSGIMSYGIGKSKTNIAQWRLLLIALGAFSFLWSILLLIFLPDSPTTCWYLSKREKYICVRRVQNNNTGMEGKKIKWYQVKECILDRKTWLLVLFACAQNIPNGGVLTFSAFIVSGLGYTPLITTLLGIPTGIVATTWQLILAVLCAKLHNKRCAVIALANIVPTACAIIMWKLSRQNKKGLLTAYYLFYCYWGPFVMSTSIPMANVSGHTKKVTMNALFFLAYCTGNIIGPQVFRASDAPDYPKGYMGLLACFLVSIVTISLYGFQCRAENATRDRQQIYAQSVLVEPFSDKTDREKADFRYIY